MAPQIQIRCTWATQIVCTCSTGSLKQLQCSGWIHNRLHCREQGISFDENSRIVSHCDSRNIQIWESISLITYTVNATVSKKIWFSWAETKVSLHDECWFGPLLVWQGRKWCILPICKIPNHPLCNAGHPSGKIKPSPFTLNCAFVIHIPSGNKPLLAYLLSDASTSLSLVIPVWWSLHRKRTRR